MRGVLSVRVANSARSQMADGIARRLLPPAVKVGRSGCRPTSVRPEVMAVLKEIGIDVCAYRSTAVDRPPAVEVDTSVRRGGVRLVPRRSRVAPPGAARPCGGHGREATPLEAFRKARAELQTRLERLAVEAGRRGDAR